MQRELEATRAELRRGVLELPQETAESTAQMRRVIVDQIEALAELNRIVARHGRSLDAVEPARRGRDEAAPLAIVGGRSEPAPRSEPPPRPEPRSAAARCRELRAALAAPHARAAGGAGAGRAAVIRRRPRLAVRPAQPRLARGGRAGPRIQPRARARP